jgi:thioesterase domain-containing protein
LNLSADDLSGLSAQQKRQLLAELLQKRSSQPKDRPLSIGQERLYRLSQLNPGVPLYNVAVAYRLLGPIKIEAIEQAVSRILERHEILRTTFPVVDGKPVQRIAPAQAHPDAFLRVDLGAAPEADRSQRANQVIESEITQNIELAEAPLWRLALIRLGDREHMLVLTMHHIVTDGWSFDLFLKELATLYGADDKNRTNRLGELSIQYSEYAERQRQSLVGVEFEKQRSYWTDQLAGSIPLLRLPTDRSKSVQAKRNAASFPFALSSELSRALTNLSQSENATMFMTLLAAFAALLHESTQQDDLLLCTPVTGRHRPQSKSLIGYFNNILPIRLDLSGDPTLLELMRRTRRVALDAYNNQDVPFQWIADLPSLRRISLSRLLFSLDMEWPPRFDLPGVLCEPIAIDPGAADFDLSVSLWASCGQILGNLRFKQELFDQSTIAHLSESYRTLLTILVNEPERALSSLPRLALRSEQAQIPVAAKNDDEAGGLLANLPRSAIEARLVQEWEDEFEQHPIGIHDDLQSLGASSLAVASLAVRIQSVFQTDVPITEIFQAGTIERMAALLQSRDKSVTRSPLAPIRPHGTKQPLFLCEGVGLYFPIVRYLGGDQPVYGLITENIAEYPKVEDLAAHYLSAVLEIQPKGPYRLGGASFGGLVAFEMAQQLHAMGQRVGLLALIDTPGPAAYRLKAPVARALGHVKNLMRHGYPYLRHKMAKRIKRPARTLVDRKYAMPSAEARRDQIADVASMRRLFRQSATNYQIKPYTGRITLFVLAERDAMSDSLFDPALGHISPFLGWDSVATEEVERYELEGEHITILREPFVGRLGRYLKGCLDREARNHSVQPDV